MKVVIFSNGSVVCNDTPCTALAVETQMCLDCPLNEVFQKIYANCDPLRCRKILCAGCEFRLRYGG